MGCPGSPLSQEWSRTCVRIAQEKARLADVLEFDALLEPLGSQPAIRGRVSRQRPNAGTLQATSVSDGLHIEGLSRSSGAGASSESCCVKRRGGTSQLPRTAASPELRSTQNRLFPLLLGHEHGFNDFVEGLCGKFYADKLLLRLFGRVEKLAPGVYSAAAGDSILKGSSRNEQELPGGS